MNRGTKQCQQTRDSSGRFVNHGQYVEWYPNGGKATAGEYKYGRKQGRWLEWDETGKKISDLFYEDGAPVPVERAKPISQ